MPANQPEPVKSRTDIPDDEIEIIDLLRVIWKWKYLIISGTAVCALAAAILSFNMQPIYKVRMVLKSGINKEDANGKTIYLDSVVNFKSIIENELLFKVSDYSKNRNKGRVLSLGEYKLKADNKTNKLAILYESTDREEGIENLNYLSHMLIERYKKRLKQLQDKYDYELLIAKRQIEYSIDEEKFITSKLIDIQQRLNNFAEDIRPLNDSSETKVKSQNTLIDYASIVEKIADLKRRQSEVNSAISIYKIEIADLEYEKPSKQAIIVAQPPSASQHPIKANKRRNVMLATSVGLLMMILISFFLEYISRNKLQKASNGRERY